MITSEIEGFCCHEVGNAEALEQISPCFLFAYVDWLTSLRLWLSRLWNCVMLRTAKLDSVFSTQKHDVATKQ